MKFSAEQISPGKWGIYSNSKLLATVASEAICRTVMANIANGRRDLPDKDVNAIYQISAGFNPPFAQPAKVSSSFAASKSAEAVPASSVSSSAVPAIATINVQIDAQTDVPVEPQPVDTQAIEDMLDLLSEQQLEEVLIKAQQGSIAGILEATLAG